MTTNLQYVQETMRDVAARLKLPENYVQDVDADVSMIGRYPTPCVWLLRTSGSVLVPARLGVDPAYITHWLWGNHGQEVVPFIVDLEHRRVEKVSFEKAEALIMELPCQISATENKQTIAKKVDHVLEQGVNLRIWGLFNPPSAVQSVGGWSNWQNYFANSGNHLMANFMGKAIRFAALKKSA